MNNEDLKFLYNLHGMIGKYDFIRFIDIVANCEGRFSSFSACNLDCSKCIYRDITRYEEEMNNGSKKKCSV